MSAEAYKILTHEEKKNLLHVLQYLAKQEKREKNSDIISIMIALLHENFSLEHQLVSNNENLSTEDIKELVKKVFVQFETIALPPVITQKYIEEISHIADKLALLSDAVSRLKVLLDKAMAECDNEPYVVRPSNITVQ